MSQLKVGANVAQMRFHFVPDSKIRFGKIIMKVPNINSSYNCTPYYKVMWDNGDILTYSDYELNNQTIFRVFTDQKKFLAFKLKEC